MELNTNLFVPVNYLCCFIVVSFQDHGGKILVHCVAGVSRSATLCIIYLVKYEKMTLRQAYYCIRAVRPIIRPNVGFWSQMVEYERKYRGDRLGKQNRVL